MSASYKNDDLGGSGSKHQAEPVNAADEQSGDNRSSSQRSSLQDNTLNNARHIQDIIESIQDSYYEVDLKGNLKQFNTAYCELLGYTAEQMWKLTPHDRHTKEMAALINRAFIEVYKTGVSKKSLDWEYIHKDRSTVRVEGSVNLVRDAKGELAGFRGILRDVTEQRKIEQALRESEARFRALTHLSSDWYWEQDEEFRFTRLESRDATRDSVRNELFGKRTWETGYDIQGDEGWNGFRQLLESHQPFRDVVMHRQLEGEKRHFVNVSGEPVFNCEGVFTGYRGVSREITDQKLAEERIQYMATHDTLTKLPNRAMFSQLLNIAVSGALRYQRNFAVLFIDLDRFKIVNDTLGHEAGDLLLQEISQRFKNAIRASDVLARLGGDEFVILLQEVSDTAQASIVARKILLAAFDPVVLMGQECRVTASIGIAMYPSHGEDEPMLMKNADIAMYAAKEEGKNNFQFFSKEIKTSSLKRLSLEANLRHALERKELFLHYQAKVDLVNRKISGVEALLRWECAELGSVSPAQFIPLAEETGLIIAIGKWVLRSACIQNMEWQRQGLPPICMAVNLSVRQFADADLLDDIRAVLKETGMPPELLELEITEGMVIVNTDRAITLLRAIKNIGVRIAIDDFGTGYSSLAQLKNFPIDTLKVDRSFIRDIATNSKHKGITEAIIAMGKTLSMTVVAEGVETTEQEAFLLDHGCDEMQGYYFSKPIAANEFAELMLTHVEALRVSRQV
ncbi:MAG: hypothetical protein JWQ23_1375 [Herminiimonas sp.]|nr:hypothetical protein [Herminiimonas sp.]